MQPPPTGKNNHSDESGSSNIQEGRIQAAMEDFLVQLEQGEQPHIDDFVSRFPGLEKELRHHLEGLQFLYGTTRPDPSSSELHRFPQTMGNYRIIRQLGRGGMGVVFEAEHIVQGVPVALKVLPKRDLLQEQRLKRFENEGYVASRLTHPNIVKLLEVGVEDGFHFHVLELIKGKSLADWIDEWNSKRGPHAGLSDDQLSQRLTKAVRYCVQIAIALQYAHEMSILHRDVKPSNILIDDQDTAKLTDFGLAKNDESDLTMTGDVIGTQHYMSPEQAIGNHAIVDRRADVFSLGATLYEAATLTKPFLHRSVFDEPVAPRRIVHQIPRDLETIIMKAMTPEIAARYQTAESFADDLQRFLQKRKINARKRNMLDRIGYWIGKHKAVAASVAALFFALTSLLVATTILAFQAQSETRKALEESQAHADHVEDLLYIADLQLAYNAWDKQRSDQAAEILDRYIPEADVVDRRGSAWYLLNSLVQQPASYVVGKQEEPIRELAVFPDHKRVATVGDNGFLKVWDIASRKLVRSIKTGNASLSSVALSPDGLTIATGGLTVDLWSMKTAAQPP